MAIVESAGVVHGVLGMILLFAIIFSLIALISPFKKKISPLKASSAIAFIASLVINFAGVFMYGIYREPGGSKSIIKAGSSPWVHTILMELKEHIGFFIPVLLAIALIMVFHYEREIFKNKEIKKAIGLFFTLALVWAFAAMLLGAYITSIQPIA